MTPVPPLTGPSDEELVAALRQSDRNAFDRLVHRHLASIHRYLWRLTGSPEDAEELAQETFLRLWQRAASYRPGKARLTTWLHRVAHNLAVDELRRRRPQGSVADDEAVDDSADPEAGALAAETRRRLDAAIRALPASQRSALLLCQVQGLSNREAASVLDVSVRGLESLLARARRNLRESLQSDTGPSLPAATAGPTVNHGCNGP